jgi:hypothetical protein
MEGFNGQQQLQGSKRVFGRSLSNGRSSMMSKFQKTSSQTTDGTQTSAQEFAAYRKEPAALKFGV